MGAGSWVGAGSREEPTAICLLPGVALPLSLAQEVAQGQGTKSHIFNSKNNNLGRVVCC